MIAQKIKACLPDAVRDTVFAIRQHRRAHGRFPRLLRPKSFNEQILRRKLIGRSSIFRTFADKYAVRQYVAERLSADILPKLYCVESEPERICFDELPKRFVVKPTHGSGWVRVVLDRDALDRDELLRTCRKWLALDYHSVLREFQYKNIPRRIMIEEFIDDGTGSAPNDYKFMVFHGKVHLIQIDGTRFTNHCRSLYTPDWRNTHVRFHYDRIEGQIPRPVNLERMVQIAEQLSGGLDFIRVDLYDTGRQVYFGEMTATPGCGVERMDPVVMDDQLGALWRSRPAATHGHLGSV